MVKCETGYSCSTIKLLLSPPPTSSSSASAAATTGGGTCRRLVCFHLCGVWDEKGVDVGAIGRALGLEPASVRLNGYLLGTGPPDHVAASVTWRSLIAFFSGRGLPTGAAGSCGGLLAGGIPVDSPIIVQGRPASPFSLSLDRNPPGLCYHYGCTSGCHQAGGECNLCCRSKSAFQESSPRERGKLGRRSSRVLEDMVGDSALRVNKKLRLDDDEESPLKTTGGDSGPCSEKMKPWACHPPSGFMLNCDLGHRKRSREDELVVAFPCKRIM